MDSHDSDTCADLAIGVMHSAVAHDLSGVVGGGLATWALVDFNPAGVAVADKAYDKGEHWGETIGPVLEGTLTYMACLPAQTGSDYGKAIGESIHDLLSPHHVDPIAVTPAVGQYDLPDMASTQWQTIADAQVAAGAWASQPPVAELAPGAFASVLDSPSFAAAPVAAAQHTHADFSMAAAVDHGTHDSGSSHDSGGPSNQGGEGSL